jgi:anti-sigma B factor antagonist
MRIMTCAPRGGIVAASRLKLSSDNDCGFAFSFAGLIASRRGVEAMDKTRTLKISVRADASAAVVDLEGAIDLGNSTVLRATLFETLQTTPRLALNMSAVRYIDSSGIATLIEALKKSRDLKKDFLLFGVGERVHAVLKLTNLLGVFQIFDTEEHALEPHGRQSE